MKPWRFINAYREAVLHSMSDNDGKQKEHEINKITVKHISFIYAQGLRLALYKGSHATAARLVQKVVAGGEPDNRALWVKLTKMFNVPRIVHWDPILGLQADSARPGDSFHPIR